MRLLIYQNELNAICFDEYFSYLNSIKNIIDKPIYDFLKTPNLVADQAAPITIAFSIRLASTKRGYEKELRLRLLNLY